MRYEVYHANTRDTRFEHNPDGWMNRKDGDYVHVATVDADGLGAVYEKTNHIESDWQQNRGVMPIGNRNRSTSVGDVIIDTNDKAHMVAPYGFTEIGKEVEYEVTVKVRIRTHDNQDDKLHFYAGWHLEQNLKGFLKDTLEVKINRIE